MTALRALAVIAAALLITLSACGAGPARPALAAAVSARQAGR